MGNHCTTNTLGTNHPARTTKSKSSLVSTIPSKCETVLVPMSSTDCDDINQRQPTFESEDTHESNKSITYLDDFAPKDDISIENVKKDDLDIVEKPRQAPLKAATSTFTGLPLGPLLPPPPRASTPRSFVRHVESGVQKELRRQRAAENNAKWLSKSNLPPSVPHGPDHLFTLKKPL